MTGFQTVADGKGSPFTVPSTVISSPGRWSLGAPSPADIDIFNGFFPDNKYKGHSAARLSVLKPKGKGKYKLVEAERRRSSSRGGSARSPIFTLGKALKVKKGQRIALTMPTWVPAYQFNLPSGDNQWKASREKGKCSSDNAKKAKPQQKVGSTREYGCRFNGERLLYWAYFVPSGGGKKN